MRLRRYLIGFGSKNFQKGSWGFPFCKKIFHVFFFEVGGRATLGEAVCVLWGRQQAQTASMEQVEANHSEKVTTTISEKDFYGEMSNNHVM